MSNAINTYAFERDAAQRTNIAERTAVYARVGSGSARDARVREVALAANERAEIARCQRENAGHLSAFWARRLGITSAGSPAA